MENPMSGAPVGDMQGPGPTSRAFFSQRLRLRYVDWGNASAPPLLLVHGGRDHCRNWDWVAERLRNKWHVIAPDLRGHGDSEWSRSGTYSMIGYIYDLAQLIHQLKLAPVTIIAHSLGGNIALRYAGIYPENVARIVAIEGLGPSPKRAAERYGKPIEERLANWIEEQRKLSGRLPRRYATIEDAYARMHEENKHLSPAQARHLTVHGVNQNEDGTYSWKFDNYVRSWPPDDMPQEQIERLWSRITCPTLLVYGKESWASDPRTDGRDRHFKNARIVQFERAGHWVHHDRLETFMQLVTPFIAGEPIPEGLEGVA
jgi:pimeloyl-ACP methyl ester carboxylesterase